MYKVKFHPEAYAEFEKLDGRCKQTVTKKILNIAKNPLIGKDLGNKAGIDLSGYKKVYSDRKKIRIVYKIIKQAICIDIIAIGNREDLDVYKAAYKRIA